MDTTLVSFSEKEIEKWVSDFVYLLWFKSCSAKTSKYAHPVHKESYIKEAAQKEAAPIKRSSGDVNVM